MKGFILAAGEGTRLRPLTLKIPKPLLPVAATPVLTHLTRFYLKYGVKDITINIQKKHKRVFSQWKDAYFPKNKINFLIEDKPTGTLTPINKLSNKWFSETIVVSNGDELKSFDLDKLLRWHKQHKALVTMGLAKVKDPKAYGSVKLHGDKIVKFAEKSQRSLSHYINSGIYIMSPGVKKFFPKSKKFCMLERYLFPKLAEDKLLFGYKLKGKWQDVGTWERWEQAIKSWK